MHSTTNLKLARGLKVVIDFIYILLIFFCVGLVLWMVVFGLLASRDLITSTDPIQLTLRPGEETQAGETLSAGLESQPDSAWVSEGGAASSLENGAREQVLIDLAVKFVYAIALVYLFTLLRDLLQGFIDRNLLAQERTSPLRKPG